MNLIDLLLPTEKAVTTKNILKEKGMATLIQIKKGAVLREHQSMTDALLVLVSGKVVYEEKERKEFLLETLDIVHIPAKITHKVIGEENSVLLLIQ